MSLEGKPPKTWKMGYLRGCEKNLPENLFEGLTAEVATSIFPFRPVGADSSLTKGYGGRVKRERAGVGL